MHFILMCSAKCFSSLVFSEVCCCQKRPCVKEGDGGFPCRGSTPICHRICQSACEHNIAHCHTLSLLHCVFALHCDTSACLLQVGQAVGRTIDTVWPNHRRPPPVHPLHSTLMHNALVHCYQESTLRSTLENVALLEGSVTCCVAKMHCGEYSKAACKEWGGKEVG